MVAKWHWHLCAISAVLTLSNVHLKCTGWSKNVRQALYCYHLVSPSYEWPNLWPLPTVSYPWIILGAKNVSDVRFTLSYYKFHSETILFVVHFLNFHIFFFQVFNYNFIVDIYFTHIEAWRDDVINKATR